MFQLKQTAVFEKWLARLRDNVGKARILARLDSCRFGHLGDAKTVGGGVSELRIHAGPGYRVYFAKRRGQILLLLCGGTKARQSRDIARAQALLKQFDEAGKNDD